MDNSRKKVINNMSWLLGGRIVNMILSFFVSLATARYLGPDNFGSINYVAAYVSFFSSITSLGLSVIVIKEVSMGQEDDNKSHLDRHSYEIYHSSVVNDLCDRTCLDHGW